MVPFVASLCNLSLTISNLNYDFNLHKKVQSGGHHFQAISEFTNMFLK